MKTSRPATSVGTVSVVGVLAVSLLLPAFSGREGAEDGEAPAPGLLLLPDGNDISQEYVPVPAGPIPLNDAKPVRSQDAVKYLEEHGDLPTAHLHLVSRTVVRFPAAAPGDRALTFIECGVWRDKTPIARASRAVLVQGDMPVLIRNRNIPRDAADLPPADATVDLKAAREAALGDARDAFSRLYPDAKADLTVPENPASPPRLEIWLDKERAKGKLAWALTVRSVDRSCPFLRAYWVSAREEPAILGRQDLSWPVSPGNVMGRVPPPARDPAEIGSRQYPAGAALVSLIGLARDAPPAVHGRITGKVWKDSALGTPDSPALGGLDVKLTQNGMTKIVQTQPDGTYAAPDLTGEVQAEVTLTGPLCQIFNDEKGGTVLNLSKSGQGALDFDFPAGPGKETEFSQLTAFYNVNRAHEFVKDFLPEPVRKLNKVPTHVNIPEFVCNGRWDPQENSLNFYVNHKGLCLNPACPSLVIHEYGHGLDDELGGMVDAGYSEGFGDALAVLATRSPLIGPDYFGQGKPLRDASAMHPWPSVQNKDVYMQGSAYSGFVWELIQQLKMNANDDDAYETARRLVLGSAALNPGSVPDAVNLSLVVDVKMYPGTNGQSSKHEAELTAAAKSRGFTLAHIPVR